MNVYDRTLWSELKLRNVTVRVTPKPKRPAHVFKVLSIVEGVNGHRTAMLGDIDAPIEFVYMHDCSDLPLPDKAENFNLVYTRGFGLPVMNVERTIEAYYAFYYSQKYPASIEKIVPDVLRPGDFLSFRKMTGRSHSHVIESYRVIKDFKSLKKLQSSHKQL